MTTSNELTATASNTETWTVHRSRSDIYSYQTIGPLTTIFTPPPHCKEAYVPLGFGDFDPIAYSADCRGKRVECLPGGHVEKWVVYSPELYCPVGWYTAAIVTNDDSAYAAMHEGESTAICCPSTYTFVPAITDEYVEPHQVHNVLHCGSSKSVGIHTMTRCGLDPNSNVLKQESENVVWSEIFGVKILSPADQAVPTSDLDSWDRSTDDDFTYQATLVSKATSIITAAPVIQLVWRQVDLEYAATHLSDSPIETRLPVGGIVGVVVEALIITLAVLVGVWFHLKKQRQSRRTQDHPSPTEVVESEGLEDTTKQPIDPKEKNPLESKPELDAISTVRLSGSNTKPELPATPMAIREAPIELMDDNSLTIRHELDGDPRNQVASNTSRRIA